MPSVSPVTVAPVAGETPSGNVVHAMVALWGLAFGAVPVAVRGGHRGRSRGSRIGHDGPERLLERIEPVLGHRHAHVPFGVTLLEHLLQGLRERGIEALPGVAISLQRLKEAGVPFSVGSSTHRENIDTILGVLGFTGLFSGIVTAENVKQGKPHPDVFLKAAEAIGQPIDSGADRWPWRQASSACSSRAIRT